PLALIVPLVVGLVVAAKGAPEIRGEPFVMRMARGFPITLALAAAFLFLFVTVPILRIASVVRGWSDEHVPLITEGEEYLQAARKLERLVSLHDLDAVRAPAPWWASAPSSILQKL